MINLTTVSRRAYCGVYTNCHNTVGSYSCSCKIGFESWTANAGEMICPYYILYILLIIYFLANTNLKNVVTLSSIHN